MKKSMFALFGCALVAGSVMAAEVTGNNTAVVIQKESEVSNTLYQFLVVPVKGFDIAKTGQTVGLTLNEMLPPSLYSMGTMIYKVNDAGNRYVINQNEAWVHATNNSAAGNVLFYASEPFWLKAPASSGNLNDPEDLKAYIDSIPATIFCGELAGETFTVTPSKGLTAFGNATSTDKTLGSLSVEGGAENGDVIYLIEEGTSEYKRYLYNGGWKMKNPNGGWAMIPAEGEIILPGTAAYYQR